MPTSFRTLVVTLASIGVYCLLVSFGPSLVLRQSPSSPAKLATSSPSKAVAPPAAAARIDRLQVMR